MRLVYFDSRGNEIDPPCDSSVIKTNGDKIRSMTDEEIAEMVAKEIAYLPSTILRWLKKECDT